MSKEKFVVVGLTGQTGAGKTTVSKVFENEGFTVINADLVTREVISTPKILEKLIFTFGEEILNEDGTLNRRMLAAKTFGDKEQLEKLNEIMYPPILDKIENQIDELKNAGVTKILLDAPTLFESGAQKFCNCKVSVIANEALRKERIIKRDNLTIAEAESRMASQQTDRFYILRSDYIIRNNGTSAELENQGKAIAKRVSKSNNKGESPFKNLIIWTVIVAAAILIISNTYTWLLNFMYPQKYSEFVTEYSQNYDVDKELVYAVIKCESGFKKDAVSKVNAKGLMQITEETFDWIDMKLGLDNSYEEIFDPELNVQYGTYLLSSLLNEFEDEKTALIAYHAGRGNVLKWLADENYSKDGKTLFDIPFPTTKQYADNVLNTKSIYEKLYKGE